MTAKSRSISPSLEKSSQLSPSPLQRLVTESETDSCDTSSLPHISQQLMYSERFTESYKEGKLKIAGKKGCAVPQTFHIPQNPVLSRIRNFLPQLSQANKTMASNIASNSDQQSTLSIEPFAVDGAKSDEEEVDQEEDETSKSDRSLGPKQDGSPFVEMNVALVPPEVLSKFDTDDDDDDSSSDESASEADVEEAMAVLQHKAPGCQESTNDQDGNSPLISCIEDFSQSDVNAKHVTPNR